MKYLLFSLMIVGCGGQVGGSDPRGELSEGPSEPVLEAPVPVTDPACELLDRYWDALRGSGCASQATGSVADELAGTGHSCGDAVAALDRCFDDSACWVPYTQSLFRSCTGLTPWWPAMHEGSQDPSK